MFMNAWARQTVPGSEPKAETHPWLPSGNKSTSTALKSSATTHIPPIAPCTTHELQTCDWPRNVGCDVVSAAGGDELERLSEREPPRPAPRRNPPPPPRAQPKPVITSRGQPKFSRDEYEKQQQLYEEVDDLPPVEEIESDRQQRVYRGQPSTIGQVQKDRDGYVSQVISSGRNINNNIIPASIPQNSGKIGSFSFGSQVDDRRAATVTQAPQTYSDDDILTDSHDDRRFDIETNDIGDDNDIKVIPLSRTKREAATLDVGKNETRSNSSDNLSKRSDSGDLMEYFEIVTESNMNDDDDNRYSLDDSDRGKRQVRYYLQNGYKPPSKNWALEKPIKYIEIPQPSYNSNTQSGRYQSSYNNANNNNYYENNRRPHYPTNGNSYSATNPFLVYQTDNSQSHRPFKASLPDTNPKHLQNPLHVATQIITKSPPISALNNNENPFSSLNGDFYNNNYQGNNQFKPITNRPNSQVSFQDSSFLQSSVVTGKPVPVQTSPRPQSYHKNPNEYSPRPAQNYEPESESEEDEEEYSDEDEDDKYKQAYPKPPYEFTHPSNKYANIENPFANPNFDFDAYLSKLSNGQYTTQRPQNVQSSTPKSRPVEITPVPNPKTNSHSSTLRYDGMSTPRPFSVPSGPEDVFRPVTSSPGKQNSNQYMQRPQANQQYQQQSQNSNQQTNQNFGIYQQNAGVPLEAQRPILKPPNFKDDRQLPISYSFSKPIEITLKPNQRLKENQQFSVTSKPYVFMTATGTPLILSSPKPYDLKSVNFVSLQQQQANGKPYLSTAQKPYSTYITIKNTTPNPITTLANAQLQALQQYWNSSTESISSQYVTIRPSTTPDHAKLGNLFAQAVRTSMETPTTKHHNLQFATASKASTTTVAPKRRPIPKPSPEMADYYYDEDEYYEPPVKSKYMPSSEVKPKRPFMAQNYKEYDEDSYEDSQEQTVNIKPRPISRQPFKLNTFKPETAAKNHNDVSIINKVPQKDYNIHGDGKIPIPVLVNFASPKPTVLIRPELSSYEIIQRNRTMHLRRPVHDNGPYTLKPPKYLNQTTLRPYTVRHRLSKPTAVIEPTASTDDKPRGRGKHPNIVAQMLSTPRDSHNQETRFTKTKHDGRTNSLEPTESVAPINYSPSPRPKMLYNGSQNYSPDQYDPYYAIYDEDGELYKDTDYVQQYNTASLRPAVQQTYRGTPPPVRRPVETYSPRPVSPDDYDDALIQGQISNQNQYQPPVRQSTRGEGNELGYDHNPSSVKTTLYDAPSTTQTTSTSTTQRSTTARYTEPMTPSRYTPRLAETISTTEQISTARRPSKVTNNNNDQSVTVVRSETDNDKKKYVSLTTGFSIRRNSNNTNNPYTLTLLTRPFEEYENSRRNSSVTNTNPKAKPSRYYYESSSETNENLGKLTESRNATDNSNPVISITPRTERGRWHNYWNEPTISPYKTLEKLRYNSRQENLVQVAPTSVTPTPTPFRTTTAKKLYYSNSNKQSRINPSYYSYRLEDEVVPDQTTEIFSGKVKNVIKAFLDFSSPAPQSIEESSSSTFKPSSTTPQSKQKVVNIGFQKKTVKYVDEKPSRNNVKHLQIITEPSVNNRLFTSSVGKAVSQDFSSTTPAMSTMSTIPFITTTPVMTTPFIIETSTFGRHLVPNSEIYQSKFNNFMTNAPEPIVTTASDIETSRKFQNIFKVQNGNQNVDFDKSDQLKPAIQNINEAIRAPEIELKKPSLEEVNNEIASTTSTTKSTTTTVMKVPTTISTKSVSFPTRASRVNPAIKLAASNPGSGRRSYQSSSKCSSDNSLQDPKCNEIKYQRPTSTRGRGSAHYSTLSGNDAPQPAPNRGTPPTRSRPTLKPSTAIVSENTKFVDIYANPPGRPSPVYPQPTVDKTAAKCRKDVCLLPDCSCGGRDIPGNLPVNEVPQIVLITFDDAVNDLNKPYYEELFERGRVNPNGCPISATFYVSHEWTDYSQVQNLYADGELPVEQVPQIVLLTFDDSVNDLNKVLYQDLFEKGRVNPNGCPIAATFYVSHEWTDYSQVQNLYSAGHEIASHTISHSFGEQFSQKKWNREVGGQREILAAYGGVKLEDVRGMRAPFLSIGGNKMFKMLYDSNFTYDSSMPVYENRPPSWPYTLDYKLFHDCMIPPCPTKSYPGVWEVPMVMWQDLNGGRCSMGDACANPPEAEGVYKIAPFGLFYHAAWFTQAHHKEGFIMFMDFINKMQDVWIVTNWQALQWVRDPTPISRMNGFQPFQCNYQVRNVNIREDSARRVDSDQLASAAVGQRPHSYLENERFPALPVQLSGS
ncbi:Chitin deacetylase-like 5 [Operophtera brumata]|uniref:Chitin deacetylase-like 5 n=1 Tax=Operophtera brumata TaxID=104452 RepID=A0A0L7LW40_OPEBR|nr:Chitin deacetylase-like 5 [Operophtera brumata]